MDLEKHPQNPPVATPAATGAPVGGGEGLRASDADRDRVADTLRDALAEGRLDADEHAERVESVYRAKTMGELDLLVKDLPVAGARRTPAPSAARAPEQWDGPVGPADNLVAVFSSTTRKGRWRVGARSNAFALFGSVEIDLTEALFGQRLTVINATSLFGSVEITVPENVSLRGSGTGVFGNFEVKTSEGADPEAPVVVVNGYAVFGSIEAKPKRGKLVADLSNRLRKHLGH
ncbi:DUF1707 domain-containing protein [Streptomyces sp. NPDC050504]|uniref:DUF1707 SHOCT-like domain-containing protein n=1 Tax=Streptomyces sp. NPDC050504 TaxID=3365618 RepID=UPI003797C44E